MRILRQKIQFMKKFAAGIQIDVKGPAHFKDYYIHPGIVSFNFTEGKIYHELFISSCF